MKTFYTIATMYETLNININFITEWSVNWENQLSISLVGGVTYQIPRFEDEKGYDALVTALKERTVDR